jgi:hypothetical protein
MREPQRGGTGRDPRGRNNPVGFGLYTRYAGAWHRVTDDSDMGELNAVDVADSALDVYEPIDQAGQLVSISSLPTIE